MDIECNISRLIEVGSHYMCTFYDLTCQAGLLWFGSIPVIYFFSFLFSEYMRYKKYFALLNFTVFLKLTSWMRKILVETCRRQKALTEIGMSSTVIVVGLMLAQTLAVCILLRLFTLKNAFRDLSSLASSLSVKIGRTWDDYKHVPIDLSKQ